jgi:hypothetical protein
MKTYIVSQHSKLTQSFIINYVTNFDKEIIEFVQQLDIVDTEDDDYTDIYYDLHVWEYGNQTHINYIDIPFQCSMERFIRAIS